MTPQVQHVRATVKERRDVAPGLWVIRILPDREIPFRAGQYVTIGLPAQGKLVERPYSVASAPQEREMEFFLEVVPGGKLTPQLYDAPVGSDVLVRPAAKGRFTFDFESGRRDHFMVSTVTGVAPFVSMVRDFAGREARGEAAPYRVAILQVASVSAELSYAVELSELARRSWFEYIPSISRGWLDPAWPGERGRAEDIARKYLDELGFAASSTTAYLCGNPYMIRNMEGVLERAGFEKTSIKKETYWPAEQRRA